MEGVGRTPNYSSLSDFEIASENRKAPFKQQSIAVYLNDNWKTDVKIHVNTNLQNYRKIKADTLDNLHARSELHYTS